MIYDNKTSESSLKPRVVIFSQFAFKEVLNAFSEYCKEHPDAKMKYSDWRYIKGYADDKAYSQDAFIFSNFAYPSGKVNSTIEVVRVKDDSSILLNTFLMNEGFTKWSESIVVLRYGYIVSADDSVFDNYYGTAAMATDAIEIMRTNKNNENTSLNAEDILCNTYATYNLNNCASTSDLNYITSTKAGTNFTWKDDAASVSITGINDEISELQKIMNDCGIALRKANGDFRSPRDILNDLANVFDQINKDSKTPNNKNEEEHIMKFNFDFGPCASDSVRLSIYGIAVKNPSGTWVAYDRANKNIMDVDVLNFDGRDMMYKIPVAIKDISAGDCLIHNRLPMIVTGTYGNSIAVVDVMNGEAKNILPTKSPFGFDFYTKVVSLIDGLNTSASADSPFGNLLPLLMMSSDGNTFNMGGDCELSPVMMYLAMSGNLDMSDPLMTMALFGGFGSGNNMAVMLYLMNQNKQKSVADNASAQIVK